MTFPLKAIWQNLTMTFTLKKLSMIRLLAEVSGGINEENFDIFAFSCFAVRDALLRLWDI
ncbi:MAG: hypothetical protein Fur0012_04910 [Elusimicrobiota bacterium]